jgi:hypothetical protein
MRTHLHGFDMAPSQLQNVTVTLNDFQQALAYKNHRVGVLQQVVALSSCQ